MAPTSRSRPCATAALLLLAGLVTGAGSASALELNAGHVPLSDADLQRIFPIERVDQLAPDRRRPLDLPIGPAGARLTITDENNDNTSLVIAGRDRVGAPWSVALPARVLIYGAEVYKADLDGNGIADGLIVFGTGGNGTAPTAHLITLMFDARGRPVPSAVDGYFGGDSGSLEELVDPDNRGRATLIHMSLDSDRRYWATRLYQAVDARWRRLDRFRDHALPLYTPFAEESGNQPVALKGASRPPAPDIANDKASVQGRGRLKAVTWATLDASEDITLTLAPTGGKPPVTCRPESWFSTFFAVIDQPGERRIAMLDAAPLRGLLTEVVDAGALVTLHGQRTPGRCSPELLWAELP